MKRKELKTELVAIAQRNFYESKRKPRKSNFLRNTAIASIAACILIPTIIYGGSTEFKPDRTTTTIPRNFYAATLIVNEVDHAKDIVFAKSTANGIEYTFYGVDKWNVGDICSAIMDNVCTGDPYDDKIVEKWDSGRNVTLLPTSERS